MQTLLLTAQIDGRNGMGKISSRIGLTADAFVFGLHTDLYMLIETMHTSNALDCVFIDEAQFLTRQQVQHLARCVDALAIPIVCYGLRTDFQGRLFEGSEALFALADSIKEMKSICHCGRKATMNLRINAHGKAVTHGDTIAIGGNETYVPLCRKHFYERFDKG